MMTQAILTEDGPPGALADAWAWWQARRLTYNLSLAVSGGLAYGLNAALFYFGFQHPIWLSLRGGLSMTLFLGALFLLLMGAANIAFLLGPLGEAWLKPADRGDYRRTAWGMGLGGAIAVPFLFPLVNLAFLLTRSL